MDRAKLDALGPLTGVVERLGDDAGPLLDAIDGHESNRHGRPRLSAPLLRELAAAATTGPARSQAAYALWIGARNRSDMAPVQDTLEALGADPDPAVWVYGALALACGRGDAERVDLVGKLRDLESAERPPVGWRNRFASYVWTMACCWDHAEDPEASARPSRCGACDGPRTRVVEHEGFGDLAGRWEITVVHCQDCGLYTSFELDDLRLITPPC